MPTGLGSDRAHPGRDQANPGRSPRICGKLHPTAFTQGQGFGDLDDHSRQRAIPQRFLGHRKGRGFIRGPNQQQSPGGQHRGKPARQELILSPVGSDPHHHTPAQCADDGGKAPSQGPPGFMHPTRQQGKRQGELHSSHDGYQNEFGGGIAKG